MSKTHKDSKDGIESDAATSRESKKGSTRSISEREAAEALAEYNLGSPLSDAEWNYYTHYCGLQIIRYI